MSYGHATRRKSRNKSLDKKYKAAAMKKTAKRKRLGSVIPDVAKRNAVRVCRHRKTIKAFTKCVKMQLKDYE